MRDALDKALGGAIKRSTEGRSRGYTYRMDSLRLMAAEPLLMLGIDLGLGPYADERIDFWQESFVPEVFARALRDAQVAGEDGAPRPLVVDEATIERGTIAQAPDLPPDLRVPFLIAGIALGLAIFGLARSRSRAVRAPAALFALVFELFCGVGGLVLLFLWLGTAHQSAWRNENLLSAESALPCADSCCGNAGSANVRALDARSTVVAALVAGACRVRAVLEDPAVVRAGESALDSAVPADSPRDRTVVADGRRSSSVRPA